MVGEEPAKEGFVAKETYLALNNNWEQTARYDDAGWAYRRERRMEKREAWQTAREAVGERNWENALRPFAKATIYQLQELVCDYGESPSRVLITMGWVIFLFALYYRQTGAIATSETGTCAITRGFDDCLIYSLPAFTVNSFSKFEPRNDSARLVTILESLLGTFLWKRVP